MLQLDHYSGSHVGGLGHLRNLHDMSWAEGVITSCVAVGDTPADQVGAKRVLNDAFHEKLRSIDDAARRLTCTIDDGPGPMSKESGRSLARALAKIGARYIIVDINTENVRDAVRLGEPACFGDVTSAEVLQHLGAADAREMVIAINDPDATGRATRAARRASLDLRITVRTAYKADVERLEEAGATQVFAAEVTVAGAITDRVIRSVGIGPGAEPEPSEPCADGAAKRGGER